MTRFRYWKLTSDDAKKLTHDVEKILNWEIKGIRKPENDAIFIGIFLYRNGTPYNYEAVNGIVYYHNNIDRNELPDITKFLKERFGGEEIEKGERIFLKNSKEIYTGKEIGELAEEEGHHPDISLGWGYCLIMIHTHAIKGLSINDFILASKIDKIIQLDQ